MTSSARASIVGGNISSSAFAVFKLTTNSRLAGWIRKVERNVTLEHVAYIVADYWEES